MLHGSEIWPAKKKKELTLQRAETRMIMRMCGTKVIHSSVLRHRLGIDDIISDTAI